MAFCGKGVRIIAKVLLVRGLELAGASGNMELRGEPGAAPLSGERAAIDLRYANSQYRQALTIYQQTIQKAFGDVADALIAYQKYHQDPVSDEQSVRDLQESGSVSLMQYRGGTANYLDVLHSQSSLFSAELTLAQVGNNEYQSLVSYIRRSAAAGCKLLNLQRDRCNGLRKK